MSLKQFEKLFTPNCARIGGGFPSRRVIGTTVQHFDPIVNYDHVGPFKYGPHEALGAPDHPHRGFEIITYVTQGGLMHYDSAGHKVHMPEGCVQWITGGKGIIHAEMPTEEMFEKGGTYECFQLWVTLSKKDKYIDPSYKLLSPEELPVVSSKDGKVSVKILSGTCMGKTSLIKTRQSLVYLIITIQPDGVFEENIPESYNTMLYLWKGKAKFGDKAPMKVNQLGLLNKGGSVVKVENDGEEECKLMLIGGEPTNDPVAKGGPFVMNTSEEIEVATKDAKEGNFGIIPGKEDRVAMTIKAVETQKKNGTYDGFMPQGENSDCYDHIC